MQPLKKLMQTAMKNEKPRYRDRRGHYASEAFTCRRDLYWSYTGEPITNPTDFLGTMKMEIGKAVETQLIGNWLSKAHIFGLHVVGDQVPIGISDPIVDGSLDVLAFEAESSSGERYVIEIKAKFFKGADFFMYDFNPGRPYLGQMGMYLADLYKKGTIKKGAFLFVPISERHMGTMVQLSCRYEPETDEIVCYEAITSKGDRKDLNFRLVVEEVREWFRSVDRAVAKKELPPGDYKYKYELTAEFLAEQSDATLSKMMKGDLIKGDWQPKYSRYKDKQIALDKVKLEYTAEELQKIKNEYYGRLTPTGRKRKQVA